MYLVNVGDADQREWYRIEHFRARLLPCFTTCAIGCGLAVFHETGGQGPEPAPWFDGTAAEEYPVVPGRDATDHETGILVVNVPTGGTYVPQAIVISWHPMFGRGAATGAEKRGGCGIVAHAC